MKKLLVVTLCMMLALAVFAACGGSDDPAPPPADTADTTDVADDTADVADTTDVEDDTDAGEQAATGFDEPPTTVTVWFLGGQSDNDDTLVVEAANARLRELGLNIELDPVWTGGWGMPEHAQIALDTGDSSIDVVFTSSWALNFWNNARIGNFVRLDDPENNLLERYGQDMMAELPQALWDAFTTDGPSGVGIYGVPGHKDYAALFAMDVNYARVTEILDYLGYEFSDLFDMGDDPDDERGGVNYHVFFTDLFEQVLETFKHLFGDDFFPMVPEPGNFLSHHTGSEGDVTGLGVFHTPMDPHNPALPTNPVFSLWLEDELSISVLERLYDFWNRGFMDPRLAIPDEFDIGEAQNAGDYLFGTRQYAYGYTAQASEHRGFEVRFAPLAKPVVSSVSAVGSGFAVSVYSRNQEAAVQFLNAWYTDNELAVILTEGVEGVHWNYNDEGLIVLDADARATYGTWRFGMGNIFALSPRHTDGHGYFDRFRAYNEAGIPHALLGFSFDSEPVAMEMAALTAVVSEFNHTVSIGAVDPATGVPAYLEALRANGVDRVMEELNAQAAAFLAAR